MPFKNKRIFAMAMTLALLLSACQPTPEKQIIVNKADTVYGQGPTEQTAPQSEAIQPYEAPALWQEEYALPGFTFHFNAQVHIPQMTRFPVLSVAAKTLTPQDAQAMVADIVEHANSFSPNLKTKSDLTMELMYTKRGILNPDTMEYESYPGQAQEIEALERRIAEAPEALPVYSIESFEVAELPVSLLFYTKDGATVEATILEQEALLNWQPHTILQPESWVVNGNELTGEPAGTLLEDISISQDAAIEFGERAIASNIFKNLGLIRIEKARLYNSAQKQAASQGWLLTYGRNDYGYLPMDMSSCSDPLAVSNGYYSPLKTERMQIYVDEGGVKRIQWTYPWEIEEEPLSKQVELLSFPDAQERIRQQLAYEGSWIEDDAPLFDLDQTVYDLTLTYCLTPMQDDLDRAVLVPAWIGRYKLEVEADNPSLTYSIIAINAIDGSRVTPEIGLPSAP